MLSISVSLIIPPTHHVMTDRRIIVDDRESGQDSNVLLKLVQILQILRFREDVSDLGYALIIREVHLLLNSHIPIAICKKGDRERERKRIM